MIVNYPLPDTSDSTFEDKMLADLRTRRPAKQCSETIGKVPRPPEEPRDIELPKKFAPAASPYAIVIQKHGEPFILNSKGEPGSLNPMFAPGVYQAQNKIIHDGLTRSFYEYEPRSGLWGVTPPDSMRGKLADLIFDLGNEFGHPNIAARERTDSKLVATLNNLRALSDGRFDDRPCGFVHCLNGMLNVATSEILPFAPDFKSRNATSFKWEEEASCPRFLDELLAPALDGDDIRLIQLYAGMSLMGRNLAQRLLLLTGTAGGGKTQLVTVLEHLIGRANCAQLRTEMLAERFELARLVGKTLLTGKDVPGHFLMLRGAHVLKALTGGDSLETELKGRMGSNTIDGEFCAIITSNSRLRVRLDGDTAAWRRRLLIVNYERPKPAKPIPDFARVLLTEEGAGILRWAVEGARRLLERKFAFPVTPTQQARVDSLLDESNALRSFVGTQIEISPGDTLTTAEIVESFVEFCDSRQWSVGSVGRVEKELPDVMMEIHRAAKSSSVERHGKSAKGFRGVKMADNSENGTVGTGETNPYAT